MAFSFRVKALRFIFQAFSIRFVYTCSLHVPFIFPCLPHPTHPTHPRTRPLSDHRRPLSDHRRQHTTTIRPLTTTISRSYEVINGPRIGHITLGRVFLLFGAFCCKVSTSAAPLSHALLGLLCVLFRFVRALVFFVAFVVKNIHKAFFPEKSCFWTWWSFCSLVF